MRRRCDVEQLKEASETEADGLIDCYRAKDIKEMKNDLLIYFIHFFDMLSRFYFLPV